MGQENSLKIQSSIISTDSLLGLIKAEYDLETPLYAQFIKPEGQVYEITAGLTKYILRVHYHHIHWLPQESDYLFQIEWLDFLHKLGLPISYPIRRTNGDLLGLLQAPEGPRYFALFSFAEGAGGLDATKSTLLGQSIAEIHLASNDFITLHRRLSFDLDILVKKPVMMLGSFFYGKRRKDLEALNALADL